MIATSLRILEEFRQILGRIKPEHYFAPCTVLEGGTIGQHTRHVVELYFCAFHGYEEGRVCYDSRRRDPRLEMDKDAAIEAIESIKASLHREDKIIVLKGEFHGNEFEIPSNYMRELLYNLEHCIHHLALIRPALRELGWTDIPESFGVAPATMAHRKSCVH